MAQQFQVLRCCSCRMFQVQQVKKTKKWNCKVCNEKQSVLKVFGQGSGSDCRNHVQKLNMLVGEREQSSANMPWYTKEPEERDNKNTVAQPEENLHWQEEKVSRWDKYLDKSSEEEEKTLHTEEQTCSFLKKRKYKKTSLNSIDVQSAEENRVPGFGKNRGRNSYGDTQTCGNAADKNTGTFVVEERLVHGKNEELRNVVLSNQRESPPSETFNGIVTAAVLECQVPVGQRSAAASLERVASLKRSPPNWQHIPRQTASIALDKAQTYSKQTEEANILRAGKKDSSVLPSANLQKMLSKESTAIPLVHPLAFSTATGQNSCLFSTGEDFDDYL